ncbi:MAG TPA: hypothetical protein VGA33_11660 [Thermoanaerobaculia bacterium]
MAFLPAVASEEGSEDVARRFMRAVYSHDKTSFESAIVSDPRADRPLGEKPLSFAEANEIFRETAAMEFKTVQPFTLRGSPATPGSDGQYPIGTMVRYMTGYRGTSLVVTVVRAAAGWRVDVRWWLAMIDQVPSSSDFGFWIADFGLILNPKSSRRHRQSRITRIRSCCWR